MSQARFLVFVCSAACVIAFPLLSENALGAPLLGIDHLNGNLYKVSTDNASLSYVGSTGLQSLACAVLQDDGMLYGYTTGSSPKLYKIDPTTAAATLIAPVGGLGTFIFEGAMTVSPTGTAYGVNYGSRAQDYLFTLDLNTGALTVGPRLSGSAHDVNGIVWRSDGMLVAIDQAVNAVIAIHPTTGQVSVISDFNTQSPSPILGANGDMTAIGDLAYFATAGGGANPAGSNELWKIDLYSGTLTRVGSFIGLSAKGFGALAPSTIAPEPATIALLALGGLALRPRRRPRA